MGIQPPCSRLVVRRAVLVFAASLFAGQVGRAQDSCGAEPGPIRVKEDYTLSQKKYAQYISNSKLTADIPVDDIIIGTSAEQNTSNTDFMSLDIHHAIETIRAESSSEKVQLANVCSYRICKFLEHPGPWVGQALAVLGESCGSASLKASQGIFVDQSDFDIWPRVDTAVFGANLIQTKVFTLKNNSAGPLKIVWRLQGEDPRSKLVSVDSKNKAILRDEIAIAAGESVDVNVTLNKPPLAIPYSTTVLRFSSKDSAAHFRDIQLTLVNDPESLLPEPQLMCGTFEANAVAMADVRGSSPQMQEEDDSDTHTFPFPDPSNPPTRVHYQPPYVGAWRGNGSAGGGYGTDAWALYKATCGASGTMLNMAIEGYTEGHYGFDRSGGRAGLSPNWHGKLVLTGIKSLSRWHVVIYTDIQRGAGPGDSNEIVIDAAHTRGVNLNGQDRYELELQPGTYDVNLYSHGQRIWAGQKDDFSQPFREDFHMRVTISATRVKLNAQ